MPTPDKLPGISQSDISGQDILIVNDGGTTKKITLAMLSDYLGTAGVEGSHILSIELTSQAPAGRAGVEDTYTITFREEDGTEGTATFVVQNGNDGAAGAKGDPGIQGPPGADSQVPGPKGDPGADSEVPGPKGDPGPDGLGWTGGSYDAATGIVTFTSDDGLAFATLDLRGAQGPKGDPGADSEVPGPQGSYYVKLFLRSATEPTSPTDVTWTPGTGRGTLTGANSQGWSLEVQDGDDQLWEVEAFFNPSLSTQITAWSSVFHAGAEGPAGPPGAPGQGITNVDVVHSAGPGGTTIVQFEGPTGTAIGPQVNIPPGERGLTGQTGQTGQTGESIAPFTGTPDPTNRETDFVITGTEGTDLSTFSIPWGTPGAAGTNIYALAGTPDSNSQAGKEGDVYVNTFNGEVWNYTSGVWVDSGESLVGPKGEEGTSISAGNTIPSNATGNNGDVFVDVQTGFVYNKVSGVWQAVVGETLKGPKGDQGENLRVNTTQTTFTQGENTTVYLETDETSPTQAGSFIVSTGSKGDRGSSVTTGSGNPLDAGTHVEGDVYIDNSDGEVFMYTSGAWVDTGGDLTGPIGLSGQTVQAWFASDANGTNASNTQASTLDYITFTVYTVGTPPPPAPTSGYVKYVGNDGDPGAPAALDGDGIGNVGTGAAGSDAAVSITGNAQNLEFNFTIPRGDKGEKGDTGTGQQGAQGFYNILVYATASLASAQNTDQITISSSSGIPNDSNSGTVPTSTIGNGVGQIQTQWTAAPQSATLPSVVLIASAVYDPGDPTGTIIWSEPYVASGTQGPAGAPGPAGPKGDDGDMGDPGNQGVQGLYAVFVYGIAATNSDPQTIRPQGGQGLSVRPTGTGVSNGTGISGWSFAALNQDNVGDGQSIWLSTGLYNPATPTAAIPFGLPFIATGEEGSQGPQGPPGLTYTFPNTEDITGNGNVFFEVNGTNVIANVDLSMYTPLNPSTGGGSTTDHLYTNVITTVPILANLDPQDPPMTDRGLAHHAQSVLLSEYDSSGPELQYVILAIPTTLLGTESKPTIQLNGTLNLNPESISILGTSTDWTGFWFGIREETTITITV